MLRTNKKISIGIIMVCLILFIGSTCAAGMSAQEVISNMQKTYEKQMKGINDYTVVQKGTGGVAALAGETTVYHKKAEIKGEVIYKTRTESEAMGMSIVSIYDGNYNWTGGGYNYTLYISIKTTPYYYVDITHIIYVIFICIPCFYHLSDKQL